MARFRGERNERYGEDFYDEDEWQESEQVIREIEIKTEKIKLRQSEAVDYDEPEAAQSTNLPLGRSIFDDVDE